MNNISKKKIKESIMLSTKEKLESMLRSLNYSTKDFDENDYQKTKEEWKALIIGWIEKQ